MNFFQKEIFVSDKLKQDKLKSDILRWDKIDCDTIIIKAASRLDYLFMKEFSSDKLK